MATIAVVALVGSGVYVLGRDDEPEVTADPRRVATVAACDVPVELLERMWNGYYPGRSGDIITIEQYPAIYGDRHSTPWPYTQDVPILLYGPGYIKSGRFDEPATVADLAPTFAELLEFDGLGERDGRVLTEALLPQDQRNGRPRLIFTLVWDGGGDNVLKKWRNRWPELGKLMKKSANYPEGTAGSSPSITPSVHATIGTGDYPKAHGLPDIKFRAGKRMVDSWKDFSPKFFEGETLADLWDQANGNTPKIGVMARDSWHAGMVGHGAFLAGGDQDLGLFDKLGRVEFHTRKPFFYMPDYAASFEGFDEFIEEVDQRDGENDDQWRGNPLIPTDGRIRYGPQWPPFQTKRLLEVLEGEDFGADEMPDLFYTNYKSTDLAGHEWNMVEPEVGDVVEAQDAEIPKIIRGLDRLVGRNNYVLAFTADHGQTPHANVIDAWSIEMKQVTEDLRKHFDKVTPNKSMFLANRGYYVWLDKKELRKEDGTTAEDIAAFLRDYRIGDNVSASNELGPKFRGKEQERIYLTALTPKGLKDAVECARASDAG